MLKMCFTILVFGLPVAAKGGSTETVSAPAQYQQRPIVLYGHTAAQQGARDIHPAEFRQDRPAELKKAAGPESAKKPRPRRKPDGKKAAAPAKKKLVPVHFKEEASHKSPYTCRWALGRFFEIISGPGITRSPEPQKPLKIQGADKPKD